MQSSHSSDWEQRYPNLPCRLSDDLPSSIVRSKLYRQLRHALVSVLNRGEKLFRFDYDEQKLLATLREETAISRWTHSYTRRTMPKHICLPGFIWLYVVRNRFVRRPEKEILIDPRLLDTLVSCIWFLTSDRFRDRILRYRTHGGWHRNRVKSWWIIDIECITWGTATATTTASWTARSKTVGPYGTGSQRDDVEQIKGRIGTTRFTATFAGKIFFESSEESLIGERHIIGPTTSTTSFLELPILEHILATKHSETVENSVIRLTRNLHWSLVPNETEERRNFDHSIHLHGECCWCSRESVVILSQFHWGFYGRRGLYGRSEYLHSYLSLGC